MFSICCVVTPICLLFIHVFLPEESEEQLKASHVWREYDTPSHLWREFQVSRRDWDVYGGNRHVGRTAWGLATSTSTRHSTQPLEDMSTLGLGLVHGWGK